METDSLVYWPNIFITFGLGLFLGLAVGGFIGMFASVRSSFKRAVFSDKD